MNKKSSESLIMPVARSSFPLEIVTKIIKSDLTVHFEDFVSDVPSFN